MLDAGSAADYRRLAIQRDAGAAVVAGPDVEPESMQSHDRRDNAQAQARARQLARGFAAIEALQYCVALAGRDARESGRASWRERVCQRVDIGGGRHLKKKKKKHY